MRETWKRQKIDPNYAYDTPVPSEGMPTHQRNTVAASIGELGPVELRSWGSDRIWQDTEIQIIKKIQSGQFQEMN